MCGDFNCKLDNLKDQSNSKLKKVISSFDLYDTWHSKHPQLNGYTWCNSEDIPSSRIDYIFINGNFTFDIKNIIIRKIPGTNLGKRMSDHRSIKITFNIDGNKRGNGYWKLNNSHLNDINYKTGIKKIISNLQNENLNSVEKWETFKLKSRDFSIQFSKESIHNTKNRIKSIEKEINRIEELESKDINMNRKRHLESELDSLYDKRCKGAFVRSRSKWMLEGERCSKYFLNLEKSRQKQSVIKELKVNENHFENTNDILGAMCNFYTSLYSTDNIPDEFIDNYLASLELEKVINENDANSCEEFPSLAECTDAVTNLKTNKSPGLDGLTNEFYQCFWNDIKELFYEALKMIFENGQMTFSQRTAVISLLHKKGDETSFKNYRPISLTN